MIKSYARSAEVFIVPDCTVRFGTRETFVAFSAFKFHCIKLSFFAQLYHNLQFAGLASIIFFATARWSEGLKRSSVVIVVRKLYRRANVRKVLYLNWNAPYEGLPPSFGLRAVATLPLSHSDKRDNFSSKDTESPAENSSNFPRIPLSVLGGFL